MCPPRRRVCQGKRIRADPPGRTEALSRNGGETQGRSTLARSRAGAAIIHFVEDDSALGIAAENELEWLRAMAAPRETTKVARTAPRIAEEFETLRGGPAERGKRDVDRARASIRRNVGAALTRGFERTRA